MAYKTNIYKTPLIDSTASITHPLRPQIADTETMESMNTYKNFGVFPTNQGTIPVWKRTGEGDEAKHEDFTEEEWTRESMAPYRAGAPGVRSLFNKSAALLIGNAQPVTTFDAPGQADAWDRNIRGGSEWRLSTNSPLMDTPEVRAKLQEKAACTVKDLVKASRAGVFGRSTYSYADFMYCKHVGRVPNNYLITLRRYPIPVNDAMMPTGTGKRRRQRNRDGGGQADTAAPIGTMVTWMGVSGNEMGNILKYSYTMPFEEKEARWEEVSKYGGDNGILNSIEAAMNPTIRSKFNDGYDNLPAAANASGIIGDKVGGVLSHVPGIGKHLGGMFATSGGVYQDPSTFIDSNKVYGPIDRVKSNYRRSEAGLTMDFKFTLVFEYELKAYNGINPKQAMLDLLATIVATTYTNGAFWKGGYRPIAAGQSSAFRNLEIFKPSKSNFTDYMDAFSKDVRKGYDAISSKLEGTNPLDLVKKVINIMGGMLIGGLLNQLGRPAKYQMNSLLSEAPVGLWHVTIGNPHRPILSLGNMILKNTTIEHSGPLGMDDFPTQLKVTCEFDRGKPRDAWGIEQMYMRGNDRIYQSMSKYVLDMYQKAKVYKTGTPAPDYKDIHREATGQDKGIGKILRKPGGLSLPKLEVLTQPSPSLSRASVESLAAKALTRARTGLPSITPTSLESAYSPEELDLMKKGDNTFLENYFGDVDNDAIIMAAREQEEGNFKMTASEKEESAKSQQRLESAISKKNAQPAQSES